MTTKPKLTPPQRKAARTARRAEIKAARAQLPIPWIRAQVGPLLAAGQTDQEIARKIADIIDGLLVFTAVPQPFDAIAEALDGPLAYALAMPIVKAARRAIVKAGLAAA